MYSSQENRIPKSQYSCSLTLCHCGLSILLSDTRQAAIPTLLACVELGIFFFMLLDNVKERSYFSQTNFSNRHGLNCCTFINPVALAVESQGLWDMQNNFSFLDS